MWTASVAAYQGGSGLTEVCQGKPQMPELSVENLKVRDNERKATLGVLH